MAFINGSFAAILAATVSPVLVAGGFTPQSTQPTNVVLGSEADKPFRTDSVVDRYDNRASFSRVGIRHTADRSLSEDSAAALSSLDGDSTTMTKLPGDGSQSLEYRFIGQPRWINIIEIDGNVTDVSVEMLHTSGEWRPWARSSQRLNGMLFIEGDAGRYMGIRVTPDGFGDAAVVEFAEVTARFHQVDPDSTERGEGDGKSYFYEWVENYSSSPLSKTSDDAEGLGDKLPSGWSISGYGNSSAWEEDFKRTEYGGTNNTYADEHDLVFFSGHGSTGDGEYYSDTTRCIKFSDNDHDDRKMTAGDAYDSWGDSDMEWLGMSACQTMKQDNRWASSMNGVHLIMGWETNMYDIKFGKHFAKRMVDSGSMDSAYSVKSSWFYAAEKTHWYADRTAEVIGENSTMGSDYLWGEGSVNSDPTDDGWYHRWSYDTRGRDGESCEAPSMQFVDPVDISGKAFRVRVEREVLARYGDSSRETMPIFMTTPPIVNAESAGILADNLCQRLGILCSADVGPDGDEQEIIAVSGDQEARIWFGDGSIDIIDRAIFEPQDPDYAPTLISDQDAYEMAEFVLNAIGIPMQDRVLVRQDHMWSDSYLSKDDPDVPGESFPTSNRVVYRRHIAGFPTFGPGAEATLEFGDQGKLAKASIQSWTDLEYLDEATTIDLQHALMQLAEFGGGVTTNGIRTPIAEVEVRQVELGYWVETATHGRPLLMPSYGIDCLVKNDGGELTEATLVMSAAVPAPWVKITPLQDGCHRVGDNVCMQAEVSTFDSQYAIEWIDPESGLIVGTADSLCHVFAKDNSDRPTRTRSMKVRVRDSLGNEAAATIDLCIGIATDLNGDHVVDINDLLIVLGAWGANGAPWSGGDANGDGQTNINDVLAVLADLNG